MTPQTSTATAAGVGTDADRALKARHRALWASGRSALGQPMLASYGTSFDRPVWGDWLILVAFTCVFLAATITAVATRTRVVTTRRGGAR